MSAHTPPRLLALARVVLVNISLQFNLLLLLRLLLALLLLFTTLPAQSVHGEYQDSEGRVARWVRVRVRVR